MRALLLASAAGLAFAGTAWAVTAASDATIHVTGDDGHASIHIQSDDAESVIVVNGQRIEVRDGAVFIDGERHALDGDNTVVIEDGDVRIRPGGSRHFAWRMGGPDMADLDARIAEAMALAGHMDHDGIREAHEEARRAMEAALAELEAVRDEDGHWVIENGERRELTDAEREEICSAMREARDEVRAAMRGMRAEIRTARDDMRGQRVEVRRIVRDAARHAEDAGRHAERAQALRDRLAEAGANTVRIERENGDSRVWLDDRELDGDERTEWLNRMQLEELEGGPESDGHAYFFGRGDDSDRERRVMVVRSGSDAGDEEVRVYEFSPDSGEED